MAKVESAADLTAVPGIKIAWDQLGMELTGWLANARDVDRDGNGNADVLLWTRRGYMVLVEAP